MALIAVNWRPDRGQLRWFGLIALIGFGALGAVSYFARRLLWIRLEDETASVAGLVLWGLAAACGLLAIAAPAVLRPLYVTLTAITLPIGFVLSHLMMALLFYGVFTPVGLVFRLIGRDPLHRRFDPGAASYWVERKPVKDVKLYYRQF